MFINKSYLCDTASPHSQEGIKAPQGVVCTACIQKIRHIKRKLKDLSTSPVLAPKGNTVKICSSLYCHWRVQRGTCTNSQAPGMGAVLGRHKLFTQPQAAVEKKNQEPW